MSYLFEQCGGGEPWAFTGCIAGVLEKKKIGYAMDFNIVKLDRGRNGWIEEFKKLVDKMELVDLPLVGSRWTQSNKRDNSF